MYEVVESVSLGKDGQPGTGDDALFVGDGIFAVLDGVTSPEVCDCCQRTAAQIAVKIVTDALSAFDPVQGFRTLLNMSLAALMRGVQEHSVSPKAPATAMAVFNAVRGELWFVGDCQALVGRELISPQSTNVVEGSNSIARAVKIHSLLAGGMSVDDLRATDLGRKVIAPLLENGDVLRNNPKVGDLAYGAVCSEPVPDSLISVISVPAGATEIVLATDGYPDLQPSLSASERVLKILVDQDPLCIGPLRGTKGVAPHNESFDDRTYLRLRLAT